MNDQQNSDKVELVRVPASEAIKVCIESNPEFARLMNTIYQSILDASKWGMTRFTCRLDEINRVPRKQSKWVSLESLHDAICSELEQSGYEVRVIWDFDPDAGKECGFLCVEWSCGVMMYEK